MLAAAIGASLRGVLRGLMAETIADFFRYRSADDSPVALEAAGQRQCPFIGEERAKTLGRDGSGNYFAD